MNEAPMMGGNARWEVIWWNKKKKQFSVFEFDNDLASAEELYAKVLKAEKPFATLRCCNVGFPPPKKYRPRTVKGKEVIPMLAINQKGIVWCPYCRKLRKFQLQDGFELNGIWVDAGGKYCPVCEIGSANHQVKRYNPGLYTTKKVRIHRATRSKKSNSKARRKRH